jgi:hypothetical protein
MALVISNYFRNCTYLGTYLYGKYSIETMIFWSGPKNTNHNQDGNDNDNKVWLTFFFFFFEVTEIVG